MRHSMATPSTWICIEFIGECCVVWQYVVGMGAVHMVINSAWIQRKFGNWQNLENTFLANYEQNSEYY